MFTDSHCHLNFPELHHQLPAVLQAMQAAQVTRALCIACTMEDFPQVHALALEHPHLWATVGVHPDTEGLHEPSVDELLAAAALPRVVGIGETGLDYYGMQERKGGRSIADLEWQRQRFRTHIRAAQACRKPLVIHTRAAAQDTLAILREEGEDGSSRSAEQGQEDNRRRDDPIEQALLRRQQNHGQWHGRTHGEASSRRHGGLQRASAQGFRDA